MNHSPLTSAFLCLLAALLFFSVRSAQADPKAAPTVEKYQTAEKKPCPKTKLLATGKVPCDERKEVYGPKDYDPYSQMIRLSDVQKRVLSERKVIRKVPIPYHIYAY